MRDYINLWHWWLIAPTLGMLLRGHQVLQRYQWWVLLGKEKNIFLHQPLQMISLRCWLQIHCCASSLPFLPKIPKSFELVCWQQILLKYHFIYFFLLPFQAVLVSGLRPMFLKWMKLCTLSTGKNAFINGLISLPAEFIFRESQPFSLSWISICTGPCNAGDINRVSSEIRGVEARQREHNQCLHAATMLMTWLQGITLIPNVLCVLQKRVKLTCQDLR